MLLNGSNMKKQITFQRTLAFTAIALAASASQAGMGNIGTSYGVLPADIASAQALSMFNTQVSATYYNPSYLVEDPRGEITTGIMHAEQELRAASSNRDGDVLANSPSQHVLIGMKTNLGSLTKSNHPIQLGFIAGVEKYSEEMMSFESSTSDDGQALRYGREPMFLNLGIGTKVWRGIDFGVAARITLEAGAVLNSNADLSGKTNKEELSVSASPAIRGIVSLTLNYGETFCPEKSCFVDGFETAFVYREQSNTSTSVESNIIVDQTVPDPGLSIVVKTIDSYQPQIISFGTQYKSTNWRVGVALEHQKWSDLEEEFKNDTIKDQAGVDESLKLRFNDTIIPRIGGEFRISRNFYFTTGFAYEKSPLESTASPEVNYFDNDKYVAGLGLTAIYNKTRYLSFPVKLDLAYQYQMLQKRDFDIVDADSGLTTETVETDGDIHVLSGSITLNF